MSLRAIAIGLKIPDNAAYTARTALQRLGVGVARVERNVILVRDDRGEPSALLVQIERDQRHFNPNIHAATLLEGLKPRAGEAWIEEIGARAKHVRYIGWRLIDAVGNPLARNAIAMAADVLLCNPAIERALLPDESIG